LSINSIATTPAGNSIRHLIRPNHPRKKVPIVIEADELWSFVGSKQQVVWVWAILEAETRRVVALTIADRSDFTAECLWWSLPPAIRDHAVCYTDFLHAYQTVIPADQHVPSDKGDGRTNHIERFWCTLRQRCARFVRKTLSFSKCPLNHIGALWFFVNLYNKSLH
jgi:IS1 family transposase